MQGRGAKAPGTGWVALPPDAGFPPQVPPAYAVTAFSSSNIRRIREVFLCMRKSSAAPRISGAHDAVKKICTLPLRAGENISSAFVVPTVASCIDLVVHCARNAAGKRQVMEIMALDNRVESGAIEASCILQRTEGRLEVSAASMPALEKFARAGFNVAELLEARP